MKNIDYDQPLSEEDKEWLRSVNLHDRVEINEARFGSSVVQSTEELDDDYDGWKVAELKAEADSREPKVEYTSNAKKEDLVEALRAWDREHPEVQ